MVGRHRRSCYPRSRPVYRGRSIMGMLGEIGVSGPIGGVAGS